MIDATANFMQDVRGAIRIPAGTRTRQCRGPRCKDTIYDVPKTSTPDETKPVSIKPYKDNPAGVAPTDTEDGAGISHFADCIDAPQFRPKAS